MCLSVVYAISQGVYDWHKLYHSTEWELEAFTHELRLSDFQNIRSYTYDPHNGKAGNERHEQIETLANYLNES